MKRMALIAIVLCALMLGTLGAGVVAAKQEKAPQNIKQAAPTPLKDTYQFTVKYEQKVVGKLVVDTKQLTYTFNGHGLDPGTTYYLVCADNLRSLGSADAAADGTVLVEGTVNLATVNLPARPTFVLTTTPPPVGAQAPTRITVLTSLDQQLVGYWVNVQVHVEKMDATGAYVAAPNADVTLYKTNAEPTQQVTQGWNSLGQYKTDFMGNVKLQAQTQAPGYIGLQAFKISSGTTDPLAPSTSAIKWITCGHGAYWTDGAPDQNVVGGFRVYELYWVTSVSGKLIDESNKPISGQRVELIETATNQIIAAETTNAQGEIFWSHEYAPGVDAPPISVRYTGDATHFGTIPVQIECDWHIIYPPPA